MFVNRKSVKIVTMILVLSIFLFNCSVIALASNEKSVIEQKDIGKTIISAIFFIVIALGAIVFEKEAEVRHAGKIGIVLAVVGFIVAVN